MDTNKIVIRNHKNDDACQLCGKKLVAPFKSLPAAPVYAFESGGALCPGCAKAISERTGQSIARDWAEDALHDVFGADAMMDGGEKIRTRAKKKGRNRTLYGDRCARMRGAIERLPSEEYVAMHWRWAGTEPEELPSFTWIHRLAVHREYDRYKQIEAEMSGHGGEILERAKNRLGDPGHRAWILGGESDLGTAFSKKAVDFLWALNIRTLSDLDYFSIDATIARTKREGWRSMGVRPDHGIAGIIAEIYAYMCGAYGKDVPCGTLLKGDDLKCPDCVMREYCRMRYDPENVDYDDLDPEFQDGGESGS